MIGNKFAFYVPNSILASLEEPTDCILSLCHILFEFEKGKFMPVERRLKTKHFHLKERKCIKN